MSETPTHKCPVQGEDTEYQRTLNVKTNEYGWSCIWCLMAEKVTGEAPPKPTNQGQGD